MEAASFYVYNEAVRLLLDDAADVCSRRIISSTLNAVSIRDREAVVRLML